MVISVLPAVANPVGLTIAGGVFLVGTLYLICKKNENKSCQNSSNPAFHLNSKSNTSDEETAYFVNKRKEQASKSKNIKTKESSENN